LQRPQQPRSILRVLSLDLVSALPLTYSALPSQSSLLIGNSVVLPPSFWTEFDRYAVVWMPIVIADNRTFCLETSTSGPCTTKVNVIFSLGQFNPGCPESILTFSQAAVPITWQPPRLSVSSGGEMGMVSAHSPGDLFPVGSTLVSYAEMFEPYQSDESRIKCSFNVRLYILWFILSHVVSWMCVK
jgi:hypothetical protein